MAAVMLNMSSLLLPTFGLSEVPSSPSRTVFGIVPPYLCRVFGIGTVWAENHIALLANFVHLQKITSRAHSPVPSPLLK